MTKRPNAPRADELEVSLFGPGYGECVLIHIGAGEWVIVDSCIVDGEQPAFSYLKEIGVAPERDVKLIIASHWHDDHVRGMGSLLADCQAAEFSCSAALKSDEVWNGFGAFMGANSRRNPSGVDEMKRVQEVLGGPGRRSAKWALVGKPLYRRDREGAPEVVVTALAPSDRTLTRAYQSISLLLRSSSAIGTVPAPRRNDASVVLAVDVGDSSLLLGGDLERAPDDPESGWTAVVDYDSRARRRADVFKVPHHGSENAHDDRVWSEMLVATPEAMLTPWRRGRNRLPTEGDIRRLCLLARNVHLSARFLPATAPRMSTEFLSPPKASSPTPGRVTLRRVLGTEEGWRADYEGGALAVCDAL